MKLTSLRFELEDHHEAEVWLRQKRRSVNVVDINGGTEHAQFTRNSMTGYSGYSGVLDHATMAGSGISQEIVRVLNAYGRPLPLGFVAHVLKRAPVDLRTDLEPLQQRGVVRVEGDIVALI